MRRVVTFEPTVPWTKLARRFHAFGLVSRGELMQLTLQETTAVALFLGLDGVAPHLQHEVAEAMGLTKQRVHQLLLSALRRIEWARYPTRAE